MGKHKTFSKKTAIKRFLKILLFVIIASLIFTYLQYGRITSAILVGFAIVIPIMIMSAIVGFKYQDSIAKLKNKQKSKNKLRYFFLILGILMVTINLISVFLEEGNFNYYLQIGIGLTLIVYSTYNLKNSSR